MIRSETKKSIFLLIVMVLMVSFIFMMLSPVPVSADVGNNNRYDTGDNGSSDSGQASILIIFSIIYRILGPIGLAVAGIIVLMAVVVLKQRGKSILPAHLLKQVGIDPLKSIKAFRDENSIVDEIIREDPGFASEAFKQFTSECFITLQDAWIDLMASHQGV